jgi:hypothetical protein
VGDHYVAPGKHTDQILYGYMLAVRAGRCAQQVPVVPPPLSDSTSDESALSLYALKAQMRAQEHNLIKQLRILYASQGKWAQDSYRSIWLTLNQLVGVRKITFCSPAQHQRRIDYLKDLIRTAGAQHV